MSDTKTGVEQGESSDLDEFVQEVGAHLPHADFKKSGTETVTLELSEANAHRLANGMVVTARAILEEEPEHGGWAAAQALGLNKEVRRQIRENNRGGDDD